MSPDDVLMIGRAGGGEGGERGRDASRRGKPWARSRLLSKSVRRAAIFGTRLIVLESLKPFWSTSKRSWIQEQRGWQVDLYLSIPDVAKHLTTLRVAHTIHCVTGVHVLAFMVNL